MSDKKPAMITTLIDDWKLRLEAVKDRLQLKYVPWNFDYDRIDEYERYLSMTDDEQRAFVADMPNREYEFWNSLETSRALYQDPADRSPGSITEEKVARYPERYGWKV